jgi:hypothetical protein
LRFSTDLVVKFDKALNSWVPNKSLSKNSDFRKSTKMRFFHLLLFFEACFCNERLGLSYSTLEKLFDEASSSLKLSILQNVLNIYYITESSVTSFSCERGYKINTEIISDDLQTANVHIHKPTTPLLINL